MDPLSKVLKEKEDKRKSQKRPSTAASTVKNIKEGVKLVYLLSKAKTSQKGGAAKQKKKTSTPKKKTSTPKKKTSTPKKKTSTPKKK